MIPQFRKEAVATQPNGFRISFPPSFFLSYFFPLRFSFWHSNICNGCFAGSSFPIPTGTFLLPRRPRVYFFLSSQSKTVNYQNLFAGVLERTQAVVSSKTFFLLFFPPVSGKVLHPCLLHPPRWRECDSAHASAMTFSFLSLVVSQYAGPLFQSASFQLFFLLDFRPTISQLGTRPVFLARANVHGMATWVFSRHPRALP